MVKLATLVVLAAGCQSAHEIRLLLGPDPDSISIGFQCHLPGSSKSMFENARQPDGSFHFAVVVDFVPVADHVPGCRGEDIARTCKGSCEPLLAARYCRQLVINANSQDDFIAKIKNKLLADPQIIADAPDGPVIIRAVATTQTCDQVATTPLLDGAAATGCAYSCPVELDNVETSVSLFLDALNTDCASLVAACAGFPEIN